MCFHVDLWFRPEALFLHIIYIYAISIFLYEFCFLLLTIVSCSQIQIQIQKVVYFNCYISEVQRFKGLKPCWAYLPHHLTITYIYMMTSLLAKQC